MPTFIFNMGNTYLPMIKLIDIRSFVCSSNQSKNGIKESIAKSKYIGM
ncbi:MAG: hypothetical protein J0649_01415 [Methylococcales bacterium]|jgi:hypothetical protein|nr:hypothetical protein [Methylococcales bacterium]